MQKPVIQPITVLMDTNYLQFIKDTYPPTKTTAGEEYNSDLTYITFEKSFFTSDNEIELVNEHGFSPLGFLLALRVQMSKDLGYGISITERNLKKIFSNISIDTSVPIKDLQNYYKWLLEYGLTVIIRNDEGEKVLTTQNQLYNWELKEYTRWYNAQKKKEYRARAKKAKANISDDEAEDPIEETVEEPKATNTEIPLSDNADIEVDYIPSSAYCPDPDEEDLNETSSAEIMDTTSNTKTAPPREASDMDYGFGDNDIFDLF